MEESEVIKKIKESFFDVDYSKDNSTWTPIPIDLAALLNLTILPLKPKRLDSSSLEE